MSASVPALIELQVRLAHLRYRRLFEPTTVPIMRVKVLIISARASGVVAIGALLLAFTADLRASLPHDPFGGDSVLLYDGATDIATKWHTELARMAIDQEAVKACAEEALSDCSGVLKLIAIVEEARGYRGRALFGHINRAINLLLRPTPGAWLSPLDVLRLGTGDCKDYALAKYFALRQAGISPERLRLVIVHNKRRAEDHMLVAVDEGGGWLILDNRTMALVTDVEASVVYLPLFVLDDTGARRYVLPAS
jgi:predicted transglutaminase-like cysteine proteinase